MARDRANIRTDMWASTEWRRLSTGAQWLYMYLLTSPTLNYVGVADWRPSRIAAKVGDAGVQEVLGRAAELEGGRFAFADNETEEILIRSFLKHDGLLLNPNLWRSVGNDFADVSSIRLMGIIAHETQRLRDDNPEGFPTSKGGLVNPWATKHFATILDTPGTPSDTPSPPPSPTPPVAPPLRGVGRGSPTTTATATATSSNEESSSPKPSAKEEPTVKSTPYSKDFLEFWAMGMRKEDKISAWRTWEKLRKARLLPDIETLRSAVEAYVRHNPDPNFQKYPATWLNAGGWENDYTPQQPLTPTRRIFNDDDD